MRLHWNIPETKSVAKPYSFPERAKDFSFLRVVHTSSEAHRGFFSVVTGGKRTPSRADHSPPSNTTLRMGWPIPLLPLYIFVEWRMTFTFTVTCTFTITCHWMCEIQFFAEITAVWQLLSFVIKKMKLIGMSAEPLHVPAICWPAGRFIYFAVATVVECHTHTNHIGHPTPRCPRVKTDGMVTNFFFTFNSISINSCVVYFICQSGKGGSGITWEEVVDFNIRKYKKRSHVDVERVWSWQNCISAEVKNEWM